jgi:hypothetical protein
MRAITLPKTIQDQADQAIEAFYAHRSAPEALKIIHEFLESDGWDELYAISNEATALNFGSFAQEYFYDSELRAYIGLSDDEPISDVDRLDFARTQMSRLLEEFDESLVPSIVSCTIKDRKGREVIVGGYTEIHGQLGPATTWFDLVRSEEDWMSRLNERELILADEIDRISDEQILTLWRAQARERA